MKQFILILFTTFLPTISIFSQNLAPLTNREAYDFAVGDTFQYMNTPWRYHPGERSQTIIVSKKVDTLNNRYEYVVQLEAYTPTIRSGAHETKEYFTKTVGYKQVYLNLDSLVMGNKCFPIAMPTALNYCNDSLVLDYGNRKTVKQEFNYGLARGKFHIAAGLGRTLSSYSDSETFNEYKMTFYNKQGQIWGIRSSIFDEQNAKCKPLTNREVYDFEVGDVFMYSTRLHNFNTGKLDTLYKRQTILNKTLNLPDSIVYFIKIESAYASALNKIIVKTDTFVVKDLDSSAVEKLNPNKPPYPYVSDNCRILNNSNRRQYGRSLNSQTLFDYCQGLAVVQGVGVLSSYTCDFFNDGTSLIYFKKGNEEWGTPIDFSTSLFTPSVWDTKIMLSPNPTNNILNIDTDIDFDKIQVTNLSGQAVLRDSKTAQITVSNLPNGIYFLQIYGKGVLKGVKKFVIHH
jgi:Secretion system C-terminal sorting domain